MSVSLTSSDGKLYKIDKDIAFQSSLIKNMLEDLGDSTESIPITNVNSNILEKVLEYANNHKNDITKTETFGSDVVTTTTNNGTIIYTVTKNGTNIDNQVGELCQLDQIFTKSLDKDTLFEVIMAANYLDMRILLETGCKIVGGMIKGKSVKEIQEILGLEDDYFEKQKANETVEEKVEETVTSVDV
jgi:S-phase kinase-associated protein 1